MRKINITDYLKDLKSKEEQMKEPVFFTKELEKCVDEIEKIDKSVINIKTDYDADGICSAFILSDALKKLFPDKSIEVLVNDRRSGYGALNIEQNEDVQYFILDMGSNTLDVIKENYPDAFVIDHHLTPNINEMRSNPRFINPKVYEDAGDYCTTGLAFRLYELLASRQDEKHPLNQDITKNTLTAMAAIGTIADVVDLMDMHSNNRQIVKNGMQAINNATKENFNPVIGYFIQNACQELNGEDGRDILASDIRMSIAPFINGIGRMSEVIGKNGSQLVFDAFNGCTGLEACYLNEYNSLRKELSNTVKKSDAVGEFVDRNLDDFKVNVFIANDIPHSLCGPLSGNITEAIDAPVIVLTYNAETDTYSGSGRNSENTSSLKEFMDNAVGDMNIAYGGHHDAIGISRLSKDDFETFMERIDKANTEIPIQRTPEDLLVLDVTPADIIKNHQSEVIDFLKAIEPVSETIYCVANNKATKGAMISGCPRWKKKTFTDGDVKFEVKDWSHNEKKYKQDKCLLELGINTFGGVSVGFTSAYKRQFNELLERENSPSKQPEKNMTLKW